MSTTFATSVSAEELLQFPDSSHFEVVDGQLVELNMGSEASWIGGEIFFLLKAFCKAHKRGLVWPADNGYKAFPEDPNRVRRPDVSFVRWGRLPRNMPSKGYESITPDLAVEVVSPNDGAEEIEIKVDEYLRAGVLLVWVAHPETRTVQVYRPDGSSLRLGAEDELTGENVLPGFRCKVVDLFPSPSSEDVDNNGQAGN